MQYYKDIQLAGSFGPVTSLLSPVKVADVTLLYVVSGTLGVALDGNDRITLPAKSAGWLTGSQRNGRWLADGSECIVISISASGPRAKRVVQQLLGAMPQPLAPVLSPLAFEESAHRLLAELSRGHLLSQARAALLFEQLCYDLVVSVRRLCGETPGSRVDALVRRMRAAPHKEYQLREEARKCGLSYTHFRRLFCKLAGVPPREHLIQCRIQLATRQLKLNPSQTVVRLAATVGYLNPGHFSQLYKKRVGISPGRVAHRARTDPAPPLASEVASVRDAS